MKRRTSERLRSVVHDGRGSFADHNVFLAIPDPAARFQVREMHAAGMVEIMRVEWIGPDALNVVYLGLGAGGPNNHFRHLHGFANDGA
jgi:hypothetical protein